MSEFPHIHAVAFDLGVNLRERDARKQTVDCTAGMRTSQFRKHFLRFRGNRNLLQYSPQPNPAYSASLYSNPYFKASRKVGKVSAIGIAHTAT